MNEDFKKWLCELAGKYYRPVYNWQRTGCEPKQVVKRISLEILIKAMWAINREDSGYYIHQSPIVKSWEVIEKDNYEYFWYTDHNNSEQEALKSALKYVWQSLTGKE